VINIYDYNIDIMSCIENCFDGTQKSVNRRRTYNTMAKRKKVQKDKQRSTKHTHKSKDRVTRTFVYISFLFVL
jgi:iron only hydrogenase large subunit-like protein